jgi:hypothetical protein
MTIRTFWTIFIKILGIWLVLDSITVIPQFISALSFFGTTTDQSVLGLVGVFVLLLLTIGIYIFILRIFVFKTAWLIDKLHLDKGFTEDKIDINIKRPTVLAVATIVIGGLLFIDSFPLLCKQTFTFFQQKSMFRENPDSGWIIFHLVKTIIGYLLMTNSKAVVRFVDKQSLKQNDTNE